MSMVSKNITSSLIYALLATITMVSSVSVAFAQVMQSSNYQIQSDSVNFSGGLSTSTNYQLQSTAGEVATGQSSSTNYAMNAGFQQMQQISISLSGVANIDMTPSIPGVSGGIANGSTTLKVTTDSPSGYSLSISSTESPAMQKGADTIADYTPSSGNPDFSFTTGPSDSHFGFTPEGVDIMSRYKDNGSACNTGTSDTHLSCWDGLSTSAKIIASSPNANQPSGATTTINFRVGVGGSVVQAPGYYVATTTITALPL